MKKQFTNLELSSDLCLCGSHLKMNLVVKHKERQEGKKKITPIVLCYNCYQREIRKNPEYMGVSKERLVAGKHFNAHKQEMFNARRVQS